MVYSQLKLSVIMPVYNTERYLRKAIESVLNQTFKDFEFIIIDDCSTDSSLKIIEEYVRKDRRIRVLHNCCNLNVARSRNKGVKTARGKYIVQMDSDDVSFPERIKKQFRFMEDNPKVIVSGGAMELIDQNSKRLGIKRFYLKDQDIRKHIFFHCPFSHPATIIRKDLFNKAGAYNSRLNVASDYDLYFRLGRLGRFANLQDVIIQYRIHPANLTNKRHSEMKKCALLIKKKAIREYGYQMKWGDKLLLLYERVIPCELRTFFFKCLGNLGVRF